MSGQYARWQASDIDPSGTVTSVGLSAPAILTVSGSPVTTAGTLTLTLATQTANKVFAGPTSGGALAPTFRALVAGDIPALSYQPIGNYITALTGDVTAAGPGSVAATLSESISKRYIDFSNGNDANTGSIVSPWKTLQHGYTTVVDASVTKPYVFYLSGGYNNDTDGSITAKPNISLVADYQIQIAANFTISGGSTDDRCTFTNIIFNNFTWIRNDTSNISVTLNNCSFFDTAIIKQTGAGSLYVMALNTIFGHTTFQASAGFTASECYFLVDTTFVDVGSSFIFYVFTGGYNSGVMTINGGVTLASFVGFIQDVPNGASMVFVTTGSGTPTVRFDSASLPPTYTGTPTLGYSSLAQYESYTPVTSANWVAPAPTTVQAALDRIAAVVSIGGGTPIP